jgi:cell division protein FtsN
LLIAVFAAVIAVVVIFFFWPTSDESTEEQRGETIEVNSASDNVEQSKIDSAYALTSAKHTEDISKNDQQTDSEKLLEVKKIESISKPVKEEVKHIKKGSSKSSAAGLYRDIPNDQNVTQRIYTDGVQFTVQSSSWKSTSIAEREVNKLKKRGFDSFIFKVFIKSKNSTWNRVRIGYFNSRKEAEEFLQKNKI